MIRVIVQCRLRSSRLPGKALLPIAGYPSVVLAARRAARDGLDVRVATSSGADDDPVAEACASAALPVVRGPLDDVLGRFALACADLPDEALVVRLTADNVVPDASLVRALVAVHGGDPAVYAATDLAPSTLPYGVAAEAFGAGLLRAANAESTAAEREHVTGWMIRNARTVAFQAPDFGPVVAASRVTLDVIDDYLVLHALFAGVADPIAEPWDALCRRLATIVRPPAPG